MMSAAVTHAWIKKHSSIGQLFTGKQETPQTSCAVCKGARKATASHWPICDMARCAHCETIMGDCCRCECDACRNVFCSMCSTVNCDELFDRVFCLSCNQEQTKR